MNGFLLGLAGPARSGKSSAADVLRDGHGLEVISFTDPIREMLTAALDWHTGHFDGMHKVSIDARYGFSPREAMQTLGDWGRDRNSRLWVQLADAALDQLQCRRLAEGVPWRGAVFADVRFENEASWLRTRGGMVLHVSRDGSQSVRDHGSERGVDFRPGDMTLPNNGTFDDLQSRIGGVLFHLSSKLSG